MRGNAIIEAASKPDVSVREAALSQPQRERYRSTQANADSDATDVQPNASYDRIGDGYYVSPPGGSKSSFVGQR